MKYGRLERSLQAPSYHEGLRAYRKPLDVLPFPDNDINVTFWSRPMPAAPPLALPEPPSPDSAFADVLEQAAAGERKAERTRAAIRAAVCRLLDAGPPEHLKVADICRAAGIAHGTFYIYFKDIHAVIGAVLADFVPFVQAVMRAAGRSSVGGGTGAGLDRVRPATAAYVVLFARNVGLMRCLTAGLEGFPEAREAFQRLNREWAHTVADAALRDAAATGAGPLPDRDELLRRAYALGGMVDQYLVALHVHRDPTLAALSADRAAVVDTLTLIWIRGMTP